MLSELAPISKFANQIFKAHLFPAELIKRKHFRYLFFNEPYICKIWGFHGGDYEEYRLLGYKNPVPTSQDTYYVSATKPSRLMLCKI
jgi:hypothetical protein